MKVVLVHRVLPHWRAPVFRRLAAWPGIDFIALLNDFRNFLRALLVSN